MKYLAIFVALVVSYLFPLEIWNLVDDQFLPGEPPVWLNIVKVPTSFGFGIGIGLLLCSYLKQLEEE